MFEFRLPPGGAFSLLLLVALCGCDQKRVDHPLDSTLARSSVEKALQAWVDGKSPKDLQPGIIVGDPAWNEGRKLASFEVIAKEEASDGSNLYISVNRKFSEGEESSDAADAKVTYIVGTSPVVTIFPQ